MTRPLIYFAIITIFAWSCLISLAFLFPPTTKSGQLQIGIVASIVTIAHVAITLLCGLILSVVKSFLPDQKLPHLLIRDSLITGFIVGLGCTGLIVLQLLQATTPLNVVLWFAIIGTVFWIIHSIRHPKTDQPPPTIKTITNRRTALRRALNKK